MIIALTRIILLSLLSTTVLGAPIQRPRQLKKLKGLLGGGANPLAALGGAGAGGQGAGALGALGAGRKGAGGLGALGAGKLGAGAAGAGAGAGAAGAGAAGAAGKSAAQLGIAALDKLLSGLANKVCMGSIVLRIRLY